MRWVLTAGRCLESPEIEHRQATSAVVSSTTLPAAAAAVWGRVDRQSIRQPTPALAGRRTDLLYLMISAVDMLLRHCGKFLWYSASVIILSQRGSAKRCFCWDYRSDIVLSSLLWLVLHFYVLHFLNLELRRRRRSLFMEQQLKYTHAVGSSLSHTKTFGHTAARHETEMICTSPKCRTPGAIFKRVRVCL